MKIRHKIGLAILIIILIGLVIPQRIKMPIEGATKSDYNMKSFWYYPWGHSITHKGVDIFAKEGTNLYPSTNGIVIFSGQLKMGGNVILILGPKWRFHYYAHLHDIKAKSLSWANKDRVIGTVGSSGNAVGKPPHLHYSIVTPLPYLWRIDKTKQGWKKMFYLNPIEYLQKL